VAGILPFHETAVTGGGIRRRIYRQV